MTAATTAPLGFLLCDGTTKDRTIFAQLFAAIGTTYNTTGELPTEFRLPDLRQRFPLGKAPLGSGTGEDLGEYGGDIDHIHRYSHTHALNPAVLTHEHSIPAHFHDSRATGATIAIGLSGDHTHPIKFKSTGPTSGGAKKLCESPLSNWDDIDPDQIQSSQHNHANTSFSGRVGFAGGGAANGDSPFNSGDPVTTGSGRWNDGNAMSTNAPTPATENTEEANPPYVTVNYIIKT
jgi:microcystin-dependent protein